MHACSQVTSTILHELLHIISAKAYGIAMGMPIQLPRAALLPLRNTQDILLGPKTPNNHGAILAWIEKREQFISRIIAAADADHSLGKLDQKFHAWVLFKARYPTTDMLKQYLTPSYMGKLATDAQQVELVALHRFVKSISKGGVSGLLIEYDTSVSQLHLTCRYWSVHYPVTSGFKDPAGTRTCSIIAEATQDAYNQRNPA